MRAVRVLDRELAAFVAVGVRQEQRGGQVAAQPLDAAALDPHRVVDVHAELLAAGITVEQRRPNFRGQGCGHEQRVAAERVEDDVAGAFGGRAVLGKLAIAFRERRLRPARDVAVDPVRRIDEAPNLGHFGRGQHFGNLDQHRPES